MHYLVLNISWIEAVREDREIRTSKVLECPNHKVFGMAYRNYGVCVISPKKRGKLQEFEQKHCLKAQKKRCGRDKIHLD